VTDPFFEDEPYEEASPEHLPSSSGSHSRLEFDLTRTTFRESREANAGSEDVVDKRASDSSLSLPSQSTCGLACSQRRSLAPSFPQEPQSSSSHAGTSACVTASVVQTDEPRPSEEDVDVSQYFSVGSRLHSVGECTPCKFNRSRRGCKDGLDCQLCHFPHLEYTYSGIRRIMKDYGLAQRAKRNAQAAQDRYSL